MQREKAAVIADETRLLKERIDKEGANNVVQKLVSLLKLKKALERQRIYLDSESSLRHSTLLAEIAKLEEKSLCSSDDKDLIEDIDHFICNSLESLNSSKKVLAQTLKELVSLKRQFDELPIQAELIQYERRFSELYAHIQEKLRKTRKYYDTYNALVEIKDLMAKETSLLNSIYSQFQDAISSSTGRVRLVDSMDAILEGTQQKLEKVQVGLQREQKACNILRERYAAAVTDQRRCSSLLKDFQDECAKNERLRGQTSSMQHSQHQEG